MTTAAGDDDPSAGAGDPVLLDPPPAQVPAPPPVQVPDPLPGPQLEALPDRPLDPAPADAAGRPIDRRRLAEVFGEEELFPDTTGDDRDDRAAQDLRKDTDRWLTENRPPHHDR